MNVFNSETSKPFMFRNNSFQSYSNFFKELIDSKEQTSDLGFRIELPLILSSSLCEVYLIVLGRFQKSSVPVLNLKVLFGSGFDRFYKNFSLGTGSRGFGSTVLTVLRFF